MGLEDENTDYSAEEVAFHYNQLWMVEQTFRAVKSVRETRPLYDKCGETTRGHVFRGYLALMLIKELLSRLEASGKRFDWEEIKADLRALRGIELETDGKRYFVRTEPHGCCGEVLKAAAVAVPARVRR